MSKVRINDLARELEVKSKAILDTLPIVGVTEKKTHSSSLEEHEAEKVRVYLRGSSEAQSPSARAARPLRGRNQDEDRFIAHLPAGRCAEGHHATEGSGGASGARGSASSGCGKARGCASGGQANAASGCAFDPCNSGYSSSACARGAARSGCSGGGEASCTSDSERADDFGFNGSSRAAASSCTAASRGSGCASGAGHPCGPCIGRTRGSRVPTASGGTAGSYGATAASGTAHDCSADWTAPGLQSSTAEAGCTRCFHCTDRLTRRDHASRAGASGAGTADFPASASDD